MANNFPVTQLIANEMLAELGSNNSLLLTGARTYQSDFRLPDYRVGNQIELRRQNQFTVNNGRVGVLQDVQERTEDLRIDYQLNITTEYSSRELTLFVDTDPRPFSERYLRPMTQNITKRAETIIAETAITQINYTAGNPAAPINSFAVVDAVYARMQEQAIQINNDGYMALSPMQASALKAANQNAFNDTLNEDISFASRLGHYSVFDIFSNQSIQIHQVGAGAAGAVVATTVVSGSSTVDLSGLGASVNGVYLPGDIIRFTGINSVNPIDRVDTGRLMDFVVQNTVDSDGAGLGQVIVYPPIISDPASPYRNVSAPVVAGTAVTLEGTPDGRYRVNLAYPPRGLDIVMPPLEMLDAVNTSVVTDNDLNVSLRVERQGAILNDVNILRVDLLLGLRWHPDYCFRVHSSL
jgi:hypothetical protein